MSHVDGLPDLALAIAPTMSDEECDLFRRYVEDHCAIALGPDKKYLFEARLARLLARSGARDFSGFYRMVTQRHDRDLRDQLVEAIATNETLWFRDGHPFAALRDHVLPELTRRVHAERRRVRIWSAGCSTGQEPYSVAMLIDELCGKVRDQISFPYDFELVATDISQAALTLARAGRYDAVSMRRGFSAEWEPYRARYFAASGATSTLSEDVRRRVNFERFNLQDDFRHLGRFDVILLRYVAIYFSREFKVELLGRLAGALAPGGRLLLGAAEGLMEGAHALVPERIAGSHFYRQGGQ